MAYRVVAVYEEGDGYAASLLAVPDEVATRLDAAGYECEDGQLYAVPSVEMHLVHAPGWTPVGPDDPRYAPTEAELALLRARD